MQVDWNGKTAEVIDITTGEKLSAYIFVAVLPFSGYAYVEASFSMNQECWIEAHVNAFKYFGGVPRILRKRQMRQRNIRHRYWFGIVADEIILGYFIQLSMPLLNGSHPARSTAGGYLWVHYPSGWAPS